MSGVPNLYSTKCKICETNLTDKMMKLVDVEPPHSSRKKMAFVCIDCWAVHFDEQGNRLP